MIFNPSRTYDGTPKLTLSGMGGEHLEVVENFRLLGVIMRSDMKWYDNTNHICQKGYARLWLLRRLKNLGASVSELLDVYEKQVRSVLEMAVPVWQAALTQQESIKIERVQRCAFYIILGEDFKSYGEALCSLKFDKLADRRIKLCEKFAKKSLKHEKYQNWFSLNEKQSMKNTRKNSKEKANKFKPVRTRTERYRKSPLPYLTEILNKL